MPCFGNYIPVYTTDRINVIKLGQLAKCVYFGTLQTDLIMAEKVRISDFNYRENTYVVHNGDDTKSYRVVDLIEASKDLKPFDLPLQGVRIGQSPWGSSIKSFVFHHKRVEQADLKHPIILDDEGYICDGWHRISKAIIAGHTTIKAVRLEIMPEPK